MAIPFHIISTGSQGNAVVINRSILVDCGVSFKALNPFCRQLKLVLLTHIHSDHFNPTALRLLSQERPTLRFGCCQWLVAPLLAASVPASNIDVFSPGVMYGYGICNIIPFRLYHNVPNCGYKLHFPAGKVFYATDTNNLNGISARHYDLYMVEANHDEAEIRERIALKKATGEYPYELQVIKNHLSRNKCNDFIYKNMGPKSEYVYLHCHVDKENSDEGQTD